MAKQDTQKKTKGGWGGARPNAGRKAGPLGVKVHTISVRVDDRTFARYQELRKRGAKAADMLTEAINFYYCDEA